MGATMGRSGKTAKISVSVHRDHLKFLKERAGGNVSAAIAELVELAKLHQARVELIQWLGVSPLTDEEREQVRREQSGIAKSKKKKAA
jgi:hypothetical protein